MTATWSPDVFVEVWEERERADRKHAGNSIEQMHASDPRFLSALVKEVGEVAHSLTYDQVNAALGAGVIPLEATRAELIQIAGVATAWADAITRYLDEPELRQCRVCGCTDDNACPPTCSWVEDDLCSACKGAG